MVEQLREAVDNDIACLIDFYPAEENIVMPCFYPNIGIVFPEAREDL
jgi:hypothetical protein